MLKNKRKRPVTIYILVLIHLAVAIGACFLALVARGSLPEIKEQLTEGSPAIAKLISSYADIEGNAPKLAILCMGIAGISFIMAAVQYLGVGFGWTFGSLFAVGSILYFISYSLKELNYYRSESVTPLIGPIGILLYFIVFLFMIAPSVQRYFGRFEIRD